MSKFQTYIGALFARFAACPEAEYVERRGVMMVEDQFVNEVNVQDSGEYWVFTNDGRYVFNRDSLSNASLNKFGEWKLATTNGMGTVEVKFYTDVTADAIKSITDEQYDYD